MKSKMFGLSVIAAEIILGCLQQFFLVKSIVVERNLHAYYKLPADIGNHLRSTRLHSLPHEEFYILQCPRNETVNIPKPKDMYTCAVVGKYKDATLNEIDSKREQPKQYIGSSKVKIRSMLHTRVDFKPKKLHLKEKCNYLGVEKVYKPIAGSLKDERNNDEDEEEDTDDQEEVNGKRLLLNFKLKHYRGSKPRRPFDFLPLRDQTFAETDNKGLYSNHSNWRPMRKSSANPWNEGEMKNETIKRIQRDSREKDFEENNEPPPVSVELKSPETPLKYLSVKDAIRKLFNEKRQKYESKSDNDTSEAKQFFAENLKYRKGEKQMGLQTMYHRDEIFKDHIFYDDLDEHGHYKNSAKGNVTTGN